jgi:hypothetical protein
VKQEWGEGPEMGHDLNLLIVYVIAVRYVKVQEKESQRE